LIFDGLLELINFVIMLLMARLSNVTVKFHDKVFLSDFTFDFGEGFCAVFGESGSGKTTLAHVFAGLARIENGEVYLGEKEVGDISPKRRNVSLISAQTALKKGNVKDNLLFPLKVRKLGDKETKLADLPNEFLGKRVEELTGAEKAQAYFSRAMIKCPSVIIVDEPSDILDGSGVQELWRLATSAKVNVLWLTSDVEQIKDFEGNIAILRRGKVWASGSALMLKSNPPDSYVATLFGYNIINGKAVPPTAFFSGKREITVNVNFVSKVDGGYILHCHYMDLPIKIFSKDEIRGEFSVCYDEAQVIDIGH